MTTHGVRWALILAVAIFVVPASSAAEPLAEDAGLDLLVLLDQSGSMALQGKRARLLLGLASDLLARSAESGRVSHRFAVVSFGSAARIDFPFTSIRRADLDRMRRQVEAIPNRSLGHTDILAAFMAADRVFKALPAGAGRKRTILLITDGVLYVPGADPVEYQRDLRRFVADSFSHPQTAIEVLLLPARAGDATPDRQLWRGLSHDRLHELNDDDRDLLAILHRVVAGLIGARAAESVSLRTREGLTETIVLPPYLGLVVFDVYRGRPGANLAAFAPGASQPLTAKSEGVEEIKLGEVYSTLVVRSPSPGRWTFRKSHADARVKVFSQQFFPRGVLIDPAGAKTVRQHDSIAVVYRVVDADGRPLQEIRGYPLSVDVSLTRPDGHLAVLGMERHPDIVPAAFRSRERLECELPGRYWTEFLITSRDLSGRRVDVYRDRWSGFTVAAATWTDRPSTAPAAEGMTRQRLAARPRASSLQGPASLTPSRFGRTCRMLTIALAAAAAIASISLAVAKRRQSRTTSGTSRGSDEP